MEQIANLANKMRRALEMASITHEPVAYPPCWHKFPVACCGDSSNLLAAYLADHGICDFHYVVGSVLKPGGPSHAWLEGQGLIVDMTGDQFADRVQDALPPVFVSADRAWHQKYVKNHDQQGRADFRDYSSPVQSLAVMYSRLQPCLNNTNSY